MVILKINQESISRAAKIIKDGGVIIFPTDTVYGFLADARNKKAVSKIYKIKNRPKEKHLPVFLKDLDAAKKLAVITKDQEKFIKNAWPGSTTIVLQRKPVLRALFGINKKTIAIRVPKHKYLAQLLIRLNRPLVQTSVNISGKKNLNTIEEIYEQFKIQKDRPDLIINGGNLKNKPSAIIDFTSGLPKTIR